MSEYIYNPKVLTDDLMAAGLPVAGVSSAGRIDYTRELSKAEKLIETGLINAHDPNKEPELSRLETYTAAGITIEDLIFALWDHVVSGDITNSAALQKAIKAID